MMLAVSLDQPLQVEERLPSFVSLPPGVEIRPDRQLDILLADLSPDTPWGRRKVAAQKLGCQRDPAALPGLLAALPADPFWMVRCAIIQALQQIGDPAAITTLRKVARFDAFQIVRSYAAKAVERLDQGG